MDDIENPRLINRFKLQISLPNKKSMGFWGSKTSDGFSIGPIVPKGVEPYYLTFFRKEGVVNVHLTSGWEPNKKYNTIICMPPEEFDRRIWSIGHSFHETLNPSQIMSNIKVLYMGDRLLGFLNDLMRKSTITSYKGREKRKDIRLDHLVDEIPVLVHGIRTNPDAFLGLCRAKDMLENPFIVGGITEDGQLVFVNEDQLLGINLSSLREWSNNRSANVFNIVPPIHELTSLFGFSQLLEEVQRRRTFDCNLS